MLAHRSIGKSRLGAGKACGTIAICSLRAASSSSCKRARWASISSRKRFFSSVAQPRLILEPGEHLEPIDPRHHHVEQDEIEGVRLEPRDRLFAVARGLNVGVALEIEMQLQRVDVVVVVIDDKDAGRSSLRSMLAHRAVPMDAGRRTLDHVSSISNHKLAPCAGLLIPAEAGGTQFLLDSAFAGRAGRTSTPPLRLLPRGLNRSEIS